MLDKIIIWLVNDPLRVIRMRLDPPFGNRAESKPNYGNLTRYHMIINPIW